MGGIHNNVFSKLRSGLIQLKIEEREWKMYWEARFEDRSDEGLSSFDIEDIEGGDNVNNHDVDVDVGVDIDDSIIEDMV